MEPEYLSLFTNTGNFTIQVRFKDSDSSIATQTMKAEEIKKLLNFDGESFISKMRFDDHLAEIEKIDISISKNRIILHARLLWEVIDVLPNLHCSRPATPAAEVCR